jgi:hypothetical protein
MSNELVPRGDPRVFEREKDRWKGFEDRALRELLVQLQTLLETAHSAPTNAEFEEWLRAKLAEALTYGRNVTEAMGADVFVGWVAEMLHQPGWAMQCAAEPKKRAFQRAVLPYLERKLNEAVRQAKGKPMPFPGWQARNAQQAAQLLQITGQPEGPPNPPGSIALQCPHGKQWPDPACAGCYASGWDLLPGPVAAELFSALRREGRINEWGA